LRFLKRSLPEKIIRKLTRHPVAVVSTISLSMRVGKDAYRMKSGKIDAPEFRARTGSHLGALSGGLAAASVGSAIGSVLVPGIGTILGAFAGGIVGEELGARGGRKLVQQVERVVTGREPTDEKKDDEKK
jgi:phage tail tape-measure protein